MKILDIARIGTFSAILSVLSIISIPTPFGIPVTLQTFAVTLCGLILGKVNGSLSILVYIFLGVLGLPVFSGMSSGLGHLFGVTGGFIFGFFFLAFFSGFNAKSWISLLLSMLGLAICHICGIIQFRIITKNSFLISFITVSLPYIVKDIFSVILAFWLKKYSRKFN